MSSRISKPELIQKYISGYYKTKSVTIVLWVVEWGVIAILKYYYQFYMAYVILESVLVAIGVIIEVVFLLYLRWVNNLALSGEPMQPAEPGIKIELEQSIIIEPTLNTSAFEAAEIKEVNSLQTKVLMSGTMMPRNEIQVLDFTEEQKESNKELKVLDYE